MTGDTCADPIVVSALPFTTANVDITTFANNLEFSSEDVSCTGYINDGRDAFYQVTLAAGAGIHVVVTPSATVPWDPALYIVDSCASPADDSCLGGVDDGEVGESETLDYTNATSAQQVVYVVVDYWDTNGPDTGLYTLDISAL